MRESDEVVRTVGQNNAKARLGRISGIIVKEGSELLVGDPRGKYEYRVVLQGNNVVDQLRETAIFQELVASPAPMEADRMADAS